MAKVPTLDVAARILMLPEVPVLIPEVRDNAGNEARGGTSVHEDENSHERIKRERARLELANKQMEEASKMFGPGIEVIKLDDENDGRVSRSGPVKHDYTPSCPTLHKFLNDDLVFCIFDQDTLSLPNFFEDGEMPPLLRGLIASDTLLDRIKKGFLKNCRFSPENMRTLGKYLFYLMTVHPNQIVVQGCLSYLMNCRYFQPSFIDVLIIFMNWGAIKEELCRDQYVLSRLPEVSQTGFPVPTRRVVEIECIKQTILYLDYKFKTAMLQEYSSLLEPMIRLTMDDRIYNAMWGVMCSPLIQLSLNENHRIEELHFKEWNLSSQACVCLNLLRTTTLGLPLAYATLQHYFGVIENNIMYSAEVKLDTILQLYSANISAFCKETYAEIQILLNILFYCAERLGAFIPIDAQTDDDKEQIEQLFNIMAAIKGTLNSLGRCEWPVDFGEFFSRKTSFVSGHRTFSAPW